MTRNSIKRGAAADHDIGGFKILSPVGVIAGGGAMPFAVADSLASRGIGAVLIALKGACDPAAVTRYRHHWISVGQFGKAIRLLRSEGCRDLIFVGSLARPSLSEVRLDWGALRVMATYVGVSAAATIICFRVRKHLRARRLSHDRRQGGRA